MLCNIRYAMLSYVCRVVTRYVYGTPCWSYKELGPSDPGTMLCYVMSCCVMLCCIRDQVVVSYVILCYVVLCYVVLGMLCRVM